MDDSICPLNFHKVDVNNFLKTIPFTVNYMYSVSTYSFVHKSFVETTADYFLKSKSDVSTVVCDHSINTVDVVPKFEEIKNLSRSWIFYCKFLPRSYLRSL